MDMHMMLSSLMVLNASKAIGNALWIVVHACAPQKMASNALCLWVCELTTTEHWTKPPFKRYRFWYYVCEWIQDNDI